MASPARAAPACRRNANAQTGGLARAAATRQSSSGSATTATTGTDGQSCVVSAGENWELNVAALGDGA